MGLGTSKLVAESAQKVTILGQQLTFSGKVNRPSLMAGSVVGR